MSEKIDPEFEQLRREFLESLAERRIRVTGIIAEICRLGVLEVEVGPGPWSDFLFIAHKTAGVAATYDLPSLTEICGRIDDGMHGLIARSVRAVAAKSFLDWCEWVAAALSEGSKGIDPAGLLSRSTGFFDDSLR